MSQNIKQLRPDEGQTPATVEDIHAAALEYVCLVSGCELPTDDFQAAFDLAVEQVAEATRLLLESLQPKTPPMPPPVEPPNWEEEDDLGYFYRAAW